MQDYYKAWDKFNVDEAHSDEDDAGASKIKYEAPKPPQS
jgi:hypothetical protein